MGNSSSIESGYSNKDYRLQNDDGFTRSHGRITYSSGARDDRYTRINHQTAHDRDQYRVQVRDDHQRPNQHQTNDHDRKACDHLANSAMNSATAAVSLIDAVEQTEVGNPVQAAVDVASAGHDGGVAIGEALNANREMDLANQQREAGK